ncbi:hypothetical protein RRG08_051014 [Elysia crispata]|uniref:Peroxidase n=1 Tax=Elysia crispata TaxID=231223 RepID=A0AAE0Z5W5_9GAST|nr:hypothetical protein RRG08_051014 [Elysia crispata]
MRIFAFLLLVSLAYIANQASAAHKIATPAKIDGRLSGHVTFYERELLARQKRQGRGGRPRRPRPRPTRPLPANPTAAPTPPSTESPTPSTESLTTSTTATAPITTSSPAAPTTDTATCGRELYRSADGSCNNEAQPTWGAKDSAFQRMLEPVYTETNNVYGPVLTSTVDGSALPSPRLISRIVHDPDDRPERRPVMNMQWGQFLDHDITSTPINPSKETCCYDGIVASGIAQHPDVAENGPCFPILIPDGDNHFASLEARCMENKRSYQTTINDKPEQINLVTAFIDGSMVYGSTDAEMDELRSSASGDFTLPLFGA